MEKKGFISNPQQDTSNGEEQKEREPDVLKAVRPWLKPLVKAFPGTVGKTLEGLIGESVVVPLNPASPPKRHRGGS